MEPELTEVGELHSLTDWQVSEASEEAELDEFCSGEGGGHTRGPTETGPHATKRTVIKYKSRAGEGHAQKGRQTYTQERER